MYFVLDVKLELLSYTFTDSIFVRSTRLRGRESFLSVHKDLVNFHTEFGMDLPVDIYDLPFDTGST